MIRRTLAGSLVFLGVQGQALAGDNLTMQLPLLGYGEEKTEVKPKEGEKQKETTTHTSTANLSAGYFQFSIDDLQVYVYPFSSDEPKSAAVGYLFGPVEVGATVGVLHHKEKEAKAHKYLNSAGLYGNYYAELASGTNLEAGLTLSMSTESVKALDEKTGELKKTKSAGNKVGVSVAVVQSLSKHISYVGGLSYSFASSEDKDSKDKTTSSGFSVDLATFRYAIN